MIISKVTSDISPIVLSVLTIAYLMLFELGNERIKRALRPLIVVLVIVFFIIAALNIAGVYSRLG